MNKGGIGVGSASIVLVFAVLCLSIFAVISLSSALSDKSMSDASANTITGYYEADTLAECVLADILVMETVPETVRGVPVTSAFNMDLMMDVISFVCPINDAKELYVEVALYDGTYEIKSWNMRSVGDWEIVDDLPVWPGDSDEDMSSIWSGD